MSDDEEIIPKTFTPKYVTDTLESVQRESEKQLTREFARKCVKRLERGAWVTDIEIPDELRKKWIVVLDVSGALRENGWKTSIVERVCQSENRQINKLFLSVSRG